VDVTDLDLQEPLALSQDLDDGLPPVLPPGDYCAYTEPHRWHWWGRRRGGGSYHCPGIHEADGTEGPILDDIHRKRAKNATTKSVFEP